MLWLQRSFLPNDKSRQFRAKVRQQAMLEKIQMTLAMLHMFSYVRCETAKRQCLQSPHSGRPANQNAALTINVRFGEAALRRPARSRMSALGRPSLGRAMGLANMLRSI
ncbi:MAG: hypothetical protein ACSHWY_04400 [Octadecabacter sp.]